MSQKVRICSECGTSFATAVAAQSEARRPDVTCSAVCRRVRKTRLQRARRGTVRPSTEVVVKALIKVLSCGHAKEMLSRKRVAYCVRCQKRRRVDSAATIAAHGG